MTLDFEPQTKTGVKHTAQLSNLVGMSESTHVHFSLFLSRLKIFIFSPP